MGFCLVQQEKSFISKEINQQKKPRGWRFWLLISSAALFLFIGAGGGVLYKLKYEDWKMVWLARKHEQGQKYLHQYYEAKLKIKNNPNDAEAYLKMGEAKEELGDSIGAEKAYLKSLAIDSKNLAAINNLANLYIKRKDYPKAEEYYLKALDLQPKNITAYQTLVSFYFNDYPEKNHEIEKIILRGLKEMPDDQNLLSMLASYYRLIAGDNKKAIEIYQRILLLRPNDVLLKAEIEKLKQK